MHIYLHCTHETCSTTAVQADCRQGSSRGIERFLVFSRATQELFDKGRLGSNKGGVSSNILNILTWILRIMVMIMIVIP